jgi:hypothetical protein
MNFEQAMTAEFETIPPLAGKVFPLAAPGKEAPYLVYISGDGMPDKDLGGYRDTKTVSVELNLITKTYASLKAITPLITEVLRSFQFRSIGTDGPYIREITYEEPVELYESITKLERCIINFKAYL